MRFADRFRPLRLLRLGTAVVVLGAALGVTVAADPIAWKTGGRSTAAPMSLEQRRQALTELGRRDGRRHVVLQLNRPVDAALRARLTAHGIELQASLGSTAWFAMLTDGLDVPAAAALESLARIDPVATERKLHPVLARREIVPWSIVPDPGKQAPEKRAEAASGDPTVAVYVLFHRDFDVERGIAPVATRHGGKLQSLIRSVNGAVLHLPASRIDALADEDAVMWVEPPLPRLSEVNDDNRPRTGADVLQDAPYGLDGSGVTVLVYDGGQVFAHGDFGSRLTIGASDTDGVADHATHVAGTIGGDGSGSGGQFRGMAPNVDLVSYSFEQEGGLSQGFLYTDPGDLEADYSEALNLYGADLSNNSIGTNTAPNGFPCEWEGNYGVTGALIDAIARGSLGQPYRIVWANGNERSSGACGTTYLTTAPPACAKNHITVGAMNSNDDSVTGFTSWGPTDDGRIKPDISAPGCQSGGDGGVTSTSSSGSYNVKCGTSMASPTVAGVSALLLQQYRLTFPGAPDPRNATLKAILAQTAVDLETTGPDYKTGYGSVRAQAAADLIIGERVVEAEVAQGEIYSFVVVVESGDPELKVTLAWDDPPGTPNVDPVLVNDLDLRVIDGGGTTHFPWTLDPANPAAPAVRTVRDARNNIEQVVIDAPATGAYRVEIEGFAIADGPTQPFGVTAAPSLINCAPRGLLAASTTRIACTADLGLSVIDCDLNTDDGAIETVQVSVTSGSEPAGEVVTLTETAAESAAFAGSLAVSTAGGSGVLQVAEGETLVATYVDADDGEGNTNVPVTRQIVVDCSSPDVTAVGFPMINPRDATVAVDLDEPGQVEVFYGTDCAALGQSRSAIALQTHHDVRLTGLSDDTAYFVRIEAQDEAGNGSVDDNGGACYGFVTPEIPEFFTEKFDSGIDLEGFIATFTPGSPEDFYSLCVEPLQGGLPSDPTGGTDLNLSDDQPGSFDLTGGATVSLYGVSYGTVYVGPNGYVTFGSGDSTYTESFGQHFALPRVAALFDDLNPASAGSVTWRQLADRVAVTWTDVPEYSTSNMNTFQIELFFDGTLRISWLDIDAGDAVVGLSAGSGTDPDFFESDLSVAAACGPRPPYAPGLAVQTAVDESATFTLPATDDGLPEPAALALRVTSLPAFGSLSTFGGSPIGAVPFELPAGEGGMVTYQPATGYQGPDGFDYIADDGGAPPDGGLSTPGPVTITVGGPQVLYTFLGDDTDPGWTTTGDWAFGPPTGGGSHGGDPTGAATGVNVYGYNLAGDYPDNMAEETLTSAPLDLTGASGVSLEFQRWLGVESSTYDHAAVQVSTDGATWSTVWQHSGGSFSDSAWSMQSYDISAVADDQPAVQLRWTMGTTDGSVTYPGWNIDDIRVSGVVQPACAGPPAEVGGVRFADRGTLDWSRPAGGGAMFFDVMRSDSPKTFSGGVCLESNDGADTSAQDNDVPAPDAVRFYLIRAESACGAGTLGYQSLGIERTWPDCIPAP